MMITVGGETQIGIPAKFSGADDLDNIEPGHVLGADTQAVLTEYGVNKESQRLWEQRTERDH